MAVELKAWRKVVEEVVAGIADEALQRQAWFGVGPEESSPDEELCQFFDDAAIEEFLDRGGTGMNKEQVKAGQHLVMLMRTLSDQTPEHIQAADLIDDPRWQKIRAAAAHFYTLLQAGSMPV